MRVAGFVSVAVLTASAVQAEPLYVGPDEHQAASVGITLHRDDLQRWAARSGEIQAFCFFHAANVAHVDGRWYAINGIARTGLKRHWIEEDGRRATLEDGDKASGALRDFLSAVNDRMNDACP